MPSSRNLLPPPLPHKASTSSSCPSLLFLLSLSLIALLRPGFYSTAPSSLFSLRVPLSQYARRRAYQIYPYGTVCSDAARSHFHSRFNRSHRPLGAAPHTKSIAQSFNRVLLSSIPHEVGDGLGHRMCILNYELQLAFALGLTYAHRVSAYGSLTRVDEMAVEKLFGWGKGELTRSEVLEKGCAEVQYVNDSCEIPASAVVCNRVKTRAKGGWFDQTVVIPDAVAECYLRRGIEERYLGQICSPLVKAFLAAYGEPNTLFQIKPRLCFREYLYTNFSHTAAWFSDKYWKRTEDERGRQLELDTGRVHIALHVRRGDFFNYTNRVLIPDTTYVDMVGRIKVALDEVVQANVPITVHVFSEGVPASKQRLKDNHDIDTMDKIYVNERGERMPDDHWVRIIRGCKRFCAAYGVGRGLSRPDVHVQMHVATDTVDTLHAMIAMDFFIGSISGLSMQVVRNIGRGLVLLSVHETEILDDELLVPFDYARNNVASFLNESLLYEKVGYYVRKNRLACSTW